MTSLPPDQPASTASRASSPAPIQAPLFCSALLSQKMRPWEKERRGLQGSCLAAWPRACLTPAKMVMTDVLDPEDIEKAVGAFSATDSFSYKKFFEMVGMKKEMIQQQLQKVFKILDNNGNGFIDKNELKNFLLNFKSGSRMLTDRETNDFLKAGDTNGDGRISLDEFSALVYS
ncbi:UNVERIFIED_CONTAM: hypothetical protein K2H54_021998 [Gekko kuhli]